MSCICRKFTVKNTGDVKLTNVAVNDAQLGGAITACSRTELAAGGSFSCTFKDTPSVAADPATGYCTAAALAPTGSFRCELLI